MPSKGDLLTKAQIDLIKTWIDQGAPWPDDAVAKAPSEAAPSSDPTRLPTFKPSPAELAAVAKFEAAGFLVRPIAANLIWREANFHLQGSSVSDTNIAALKDILSLVELNLGGTKVTDAGLRHIAGLTNLMKLHLEHTLVTDKGLALLAKLSQLTYLNLYDTAVSDQGLAQLNSLKSLRQLYLWQTKVTTKGAAELQKTLPELQISRGFENEPAAIEAKAEIEKKAKTEEKKEPGK